MKTLLLFFAVLLAAGAAQAEWRSIGPSGGYMQAMATHAHDPARVYAVSYEYPENARLFASADTGASWEPRGRLPQPSVMFLSHDPFDDSTLYSGVRQMLFRSVDGGRTWSDFALPGPSLNFACDPLVEGRVFVSGYYTQGETRAALYVSTDRGATWSVSIPDPDTVGYGYGIGTDPNDSGTVYLGSLGSQVYRTTDAGGTWARVSNGIPSAAVALTISVNPADSRVLLAATSVGLMRTTDAGANWSAVGAVDYAQDVVFPGADADVAYALGRTDSVRLHVSTDRGATWSLAVPGYCASKVARLVPDPADGAGAWMSSSYGIHRTTDRGAHWFDSHDGIHISSVSCIHASPADRSRVYLELYQIGVYHSEDAGDAWQRCAYFLSCGNICGIGVAGAVDRDVLYALEGSG